MYKHLLVPLDGSSLSETILPFANSFAIKAGLRVTLIHVLEKNPPKTIHEDVHLKNEEDAERYFSRISKNAFSPETNVTWHVHTVATNQVARSIVEHEHEFGHDLVLMSIHGKNRGRRFLFGNLAQRILSEGSLSVLFVKSNGNRKKDVSFRNIVVPIDVEHDQHRVIDTAADIASRFESKIELVAVIETVTSLAIKKSLSSTFLPSSTRKIIEDQADDLEKRLAGYTEAFSMANIKAGYSLLKGEPVKSILGYTAAIDADLIVMATHGKTGTNAFWNESVSNKVSSGCKVPILLIPING
jgi:nucleotide-binding universal stress UspA family protein